MEILLDCDGVIADFVSAANRAHGRECVPQKYDWWAEWGISEQEFWRPLYGRKFWMGIEPFPYARKLILRLQEFGRVTIVTAPSDDPECAGAKADWLRFHFSIPQKSVIFGHRKYLLARPGSVLIDDSVRNVTEFAEHGGEAVLFPQSYNGGGNWEDVLTARGL